MADTAFQTQYRDEFIAGFEQRQSLLRETVTTEAVIKGNQAIFLVADSGAAEATTRGVNGLLTARADNLTQNTCTLAEWHDLVRKTGFNIFASQGNQREIMQQTTMAVMNRKIDDLIIDILDTTTVTMGSTTTIPDVALFQQAVVKLQNASVPWDSNITLLCQPDFLSYLEEAPEFASAEYVEVRPYAGSDQNASWRDRPMAYKWRNCLIITHPNLPGKATNAAVNFLYHKSAVGHAINVEGINTDAGYDGEHDYSYARCTAFMGAVMLQTAGVVEIAHDGSARA